MDGQNLSYALVQIVHNVGAVTVVGSAVFAQRPFRQDAAVQVMLAWAALAGWGAQGLSGAGFGAVSYAYYGQFPDLHGIAIAALVTKMACAAIGMMLATIFLKRQATWPDSRRVVAWRALLGLATTALVAAAFLRWFS